MTQSLNEQHGDEDVIHRYVAGTLPVDETAVFERHMLTCPACQRGVREGVTLHAALRQPVAVPAYVGARSPRFRPMVWAVPLAAAALIMIVAVRPDPVRRLGRVDRAPAFEPLAVRASASDGDHRVDSAMATYRAGQFAKAAVLLREAMRMDSSSGVLFYAGVSSLAAGDAASAIEPLRRAANQTGTAYTDDARFYLAKAWLQEGRADSAAAHLMAVPTGSRMYASARALLDSVQWARNR